jgi:hypothetical protein
MVATEAVDFKEGVRGLEAPSGVRGVKPLVKSISAERKREARGYAAHLRERAEAVREAFAALSPLIEARTADVCPHCTRVCCIDRHGTHEGEDLIFLAALGASPPQEPPLADDRLPCRHLGARGCGVERWLRPFRCTWYFCPALLEAMPRQGARPYRALVAAIGRLVALRGAFLGEAARDGHPV